MDNFVEDLNLASKYEKAWKNLLFAVETKDWVATCKFFYQINNLRKAAKETKLLPAIS